MNELTIQLDSRDEALGLFGSRDRFLKEIRDSLGLQPGDRMTFTLMRDGTVVMRVKTKSVTELAGVLHKKGRKPVPVEQLSR